MGGKKALWLIAFGILLASSAFAWWDFDWAYRVPVTVNNSNSENLTNFQVLVTMNTSALISAGKMNSTCSDIRVIDSDDTTQLPFWIEDGTCNTSATHIWVNASSLPANTNTTIYVYYGNPNAADASNGDNTFEFFDDFNGTSLDTNKWWNNSYANVSISNSQIDVRTNSAGSWGQVGTKTQFSPPFVFMAYAELYNDNNTSVYEQLGVDDRSANGTYIGSGIDQAVFYNDGSGGKKYTTVREGTIFHITRNEVINQSSKLQIVVTTSEDDFYINDTLTATSTTDVPLDPIGVWFAERDATTTGVIADWVAIREYATSDPTSTVGSEQVPYVSIQHAPTSVADLALDPENNKTSVTVTYNYTTNINVTNQTWYNCSNSSDVYGTNATLNMTYSAVGNYTVCLIANGTDASGNTTNATDNDTVQVDEYPQNLSFSYNSPPILVYDNVSFEGNATDNGAISYSWAVNGTTLSGQNVSYVFNVTGYQNVCMNVTDNVGLSKTKCANLTIQPFALVKDEDTGSVITSYNVTFDGTTYNPRTSDYKTVLPYEDKEGFMIARSTGYGTRQITVNLSTAKEIDMYLLAYANGTNTTVRIADPSNTSNYLGNELVTLSLSGNNLDQEYTDTNGFVTFLMNTSKNYCLEYENNTFCNSINVTVKQPLDEQDSSKTIANFSISVGGPVSYSYTNLNADKSFTTYLFKGTTTVLVSNDTYIARNYYVKGLEAGQNTTIQPYLLASGAGGWNSFVVENEYSQLLSDAYITAFRQINGAYRTVGQAKTDFTGSGQIYLDPTQVYYLIVERYPYQTLKFTIAPKGTTYTVTLTGGQVGSNVIANITTMKIEPSEHLVNNSTNITGTVYSPTGNINTVTMIITHKGKAIWNKTVDNVGYGTIISVNVGSLNTTSDYWHPLHVKLCMVDSEGTEKCIAHMGYSTDESETGVTKAGLVIQSDIANYTNSTGSDVHIVKAGVGVFGVLLMLAIGAVGNIWVMGIAGIMLAVLGILPIWLILVGFALGLMVMFGRRGGV